MVPKTRVATACFSCSPPDLNFLDPYFIFMYMHYNHCHRMTAHLHLNIYIIIFVISSLGIDGKYHGRILNRHDIFQCK